ncbi:O-antigen ligase family protein [Paenarthrobacter aurescens]|nr:O-antigen ligase family protein [Paenarthrobacter aurescens]MDO6164544.1 O-antigen ligase family protein [Paenarthrobacter aurescens]
MAQPQTTIAYIPVKPDFLAQAVGVVSVAVSFAYAVGFNTLVAMRPALSGLVALCVVASLLLGSLLCPRKMTSVLLLLGFMLFMGLSMSWVGIPQNMDALTRYCISLAALFVLIRLPLGDIRRLLSCAAAIILMYASVVAITAPGVTVAGVVRAGAFVGGEEGFHSSAIVISALAIVIWTSPWRWPVKLVFICTAFALLLAYGGATEMLMLGVFAIFWVANRRQWPRWLIVALCSLMVLGSVLYRDENSVEGGTVGQLGAGALGSGRLDAWNERLHIFLNESFIFQLFGGGAYSDYRVTPLWWWEEKSAHSDLVTLIMEFGLVGLLFFVICIIATRRMLSPVGSMALTAALAGMVLSNTLLDRPGLAVFWGMAIYSANLAGHGRAQKASGTVETAALPRAV